MLQILLQIDASQLCDSDLIRGMTTLICHLKCPNKPIIYVKILTLMGEIGQQPNCDITLIMDEIITFLRDQHSNKVIIGK